MDDLILSLQWYLVSLAATVACTPLTTWLGRRLPGGGIWMARPIGLLALVWPVWLLASLTSVPFSTHLLWATLLILGVANWAPRIRRKTIDRRLLRRLLASEGLYLGAFVAFLAFKGLTPRIVGGEKPMDIGMLSATMRTTVMPPADQWLAGESINYYYLGYLINGSHAKLAGIPSWTAFNLALASTFAMTVVAVAGLVWAITTELFSRRSALISAGASVLLLVVGGNVVTFAALVTDPRGTWNASFHQGPGWTSSRVIVDSPDPSVGVTINEFPAFSFIFGDLHPHVMALPYTLVALTLITGYVVRRKGQRKIEPQRHLAWQTCAEYGIGGAIVGALYPLNSVDFPTYAGLAALGLLVGGGFNRANLLRVLGFGSAAVAAWVPFWLTFVPFSGGDVRDGATFPGAQFIAQNIARYSGPATSLNEYFTIFGIVWFIALAYILYESQRLRADQMPIPTWRRANATALVIGAGIAILAGVAHAPVVVIAGLPIIFASRLIVCLWRTDRPIELISPLLYVAAFGITIVTEVVYLRDVFNGRYNTLFKIYFQVWTMLGIASAIALFTIWQQAQRQGSRVMIGGMGLVLGAVLFAYPVVAVHARVDDASLNPEQTWHSLDGLEPHGHAPNDTIPITSGYSPDDVAAIRWLNDHAQTDDVLLEAPGCQYEISGGLPTSRFSTFTGIPTIIGWEQAERQWRGQQPHLVHSLATRQQHVAMMYGNPDPTTNDLFDQYGVTLLMLGDLERFGTDHCDLAGPYAAISAANYPGPAWTLVFQSGNTQVFRRTAAQK